MVTLPVHVILDTVETDLIVPVKLTDEIFKIIMRIPQYIIYVSRSNTYFNVFPFYGERFYFQCYGKLQIWKFSVLLRHIPDLFSFRYLSLVFYQEYNEGCG